MNYSYNHFLKLKSQKNQIIETRIISGSMSPWIQTGATVKVKILSYEEAKPWDVVLFWRNETFICHILKEKNPSYFLTFPLQDLEFFTKLDPPSHKSNFLGVVVSPQFGLLQKLMLKFKLRKML